MKTWVELSPPQPGQIGEDFWLKALALIVYKNLTFYADYKNVIFSVKFTKNTLFLFLAITFYVNISTFSIIFRIRFFVKPPKNLILEEQFVYLKKWLRITFFKRLK